MMNHDERHKFYIHIETSIDCRKFCALKPESNYIRKGGKKVGREDKRSRR